MTRQRSSSVVALTLLSLAAALPGHQAFGQTLKEQLVGSWTLTDLSAVTWDGDDRNPFGPAPEGRMIFDRSGTVTCLIIGTKRPKFTLGDRLAGSPEENRAAVQSTQAFYGTYSVNEDDSTVVFHVERSSFPNWEGTSQVSVITINGDKLDQTKSGPRASWGYAIWQRVPGGKLALND